VKGFNVVYQHIYS